MKFQTFYLVVLSSTLAFLVQGSSSSPPDLYSCVDWDCEEWISKGKTLLRYHAKTAKHLNFKPNEDIFIVSKPVDKTQPDWVGKIGNKIGLVPKDMVREDKMSKNPLKFKHLFHEIPILSNQEEEQYEDDEAVTDTSNEAGIEIEDVDERDSLTRTSETGTSAEIPEQNELTASIVAPSTPLNEIPQPSSVSEATQSQSQSVSVESVVSMEEGAAQIEPEAINESALDSINLQPSTDTVLQGTTSVDYLPETPKTEAHKPTDDVTPRIPETVVLDNVLSIQSSSILMATETSTLIEPISVSRVEESSVMEEISQTDTKSDPHPHSIEELDATAVEQLPVQETETTSDVGGESTTENPLIRQSITNVAEDTQVPVVKEEETVVLDSVSSAQEVDMSTPLVSPDKVVVQEVLKQDIQEDAESSTEAENLPTSTEQIPIVSQFFSSEVVEPKDQDKPSHTFAQEEEEEQVTVTPSPDETVEDATNPSSESLSSSVSVDQISPESVTEQDGNAGESGAQSESLEPNVELKIEPADSILSEESSETSSETPLEIKTNEDMNEAKNDESVDTKSNEETVNQYESLPTEAPQIIEDPIASTTGTETSISTDEVSTTTESSHIEPSSSLNKDDLEPKTDTSEIVQGIPSFADEVTESILGTSTEVPSFPPPAENNSPSQNPETVPHEHHNPKHHHHHHHHHSHEPKDTNDKENSSIILVIKHLSSTLLSFLPEHLQDTILDVDDALVFTGIIALTLVSVCVPYFLIEGFMHGSILKKKVVELNKSLWKVSAAYETQQEEFEIFKQKAIAHDEFKKRAEQSENDLVILKKLETKHREQITALKTQQKAQMKEAVGIRAMIEKTLQDKKVVVEECEKYKAGYENAKEALMKAKEELNTFQAQAKSSALQLGITSRSSEVLTAKITMLQQEVEDMKSQLTTENEKRKNVEVEKQEIEDSKAVVEKELVEFKSICHQYEDTVSGLNDEISKLESELVTLKETLGEDSPLVEIAEVQAKAAFAEKEKESLRIRLNGLNADNENLNSKLASVSSALDEAQSEKEQTNNRLQVLETYFKEREEEYIKTIEQLQLKESVRDKGKEELIRMIEEKDNVCKDLNERLEALKSEYEDTKQQHRKEIRDLEAKDHEKWLSLCQAERKAQDARKESEMLRQRLTAITKEKEDDDGDGLNGEMPLGFSLIPQELVPPPLMDDPPSYFGLGDDFVPPPPLPDDDEREPHRPPPLGGIGGRLSPFSDLGGASVLSPIGIGRREDVDHTDGSSGSDSPSRRSPMLGRSGWVNVQHDRDGGQGQGMRRISRPPATSSPIQHGVNL